MTLSELCIRRPIMTTLVMSGILFFGAMAYRQLPVSDLPNVDFPSIQVTAALPGATPETMASSVATPLERQFSTIAGIDSMTSVSTQGTTAITIVFTLERNIDAAAQDVQAAITRAARQLPPEMPSPPTFQKVNPADQPVLYLSVRSPTLPLSAVDECAETTMAERIGMVDGVAQVAVFGSQKYAVRVQLDPNKLAAVGLGVDELVDAVSNQNVNLPTGTLNGPYQNSTIQATGQLFRAADYAPAIIGYRNQAPIRIRDVGRAVDSVENDQVASWYNGTRAIVLAIFRQPGTNTVEVVKRVQALLPGLREQMPASIEVATLFDRSVSIIESVKDVQITLGLTVALVIMVIFLFLRNLSATIIPSLAVPLSIVGTFAVLYQLGYSVDNLSLMALTLSVGFVVDDAIVMLENIVRHMEHGDGPFEAAVKGSRQIAFTILSMTLSLAAVFIPVLFMGGIVGRLLHEFAITIMAAILVSGFVSLTLTPMMCSRFLRPPAQAHHGRVYAASEAVFNGMLAAYSWTLKLVLRQKIATLIVAVVVMVATGYLFTIIPRGFLPDEDLSRVFVFTEGAQSISFDDMERHQQELAKIVADDPDVVNFMSSIGGATMNSGRMFITVKPRYEHIWPASWDFWIGWFVHLEPRDERRNHATIDQIVARLGTKFAKVVGIKAYPQNLPAIRIGGQLTKSQYQYTLQGPDTDELYRVATDLEAKIRALPQLQQVTSDLQIKNPHVNVVIDREKAGALQIPAQQIEDALYTAYGTRQVSTIYAPTNQYQVITELLPEYQTKPSVMEMLYVRSPATGKLVPLNAVTRLAPDVGPLSISHFGQIPAVTISFNLKPGVSLGDAVDKVKDIVQKTLPPTISGSFQGTAQAFEDSVKTMKWLVVLAIVVIYLILGILYESFIHPLTILSGLPSAALGALITLKLFHCELNLYGFVGIIMLIGIVKKNAIMMIDFAVEARHQGKSAHEAIYEGCLVRFRPIMMTTMAALMGTLPIALGLGAGAESRRPLGLAVVGGLLFSQLITLYLTPVVYLCFEIVLGWLFPGRQKADTPTAMYADDDNGTPGLAPAPGLAPSPAQSGGAPGLAPGFEPLVVAEEVK